jgi:hypothetical protein
MAHGYHPGRMDSERANELYGLVVTVALVAILVADLALVTIHTLALRGRGIVPGGVTRIAGWILTGLTVGLLTLFGAPPVIWFFVIAAVAWLARWAWREGQLPELALALIGGALPWAVAYVFFLAAFPAGPTTEVPDRRFFVLVAALIVVVIGASLVIAAPRTSHFRPITGPQRARLLTEAIEREQAMGPIPAPPVLALLVGLTVSTVVLVLARGLGTPLQLALSGASMILVATGVWLVAVPPRVGRAYAALKWLIRVERRIWRERAGRALPRTISGARRQIDALAGTPPSRPLRIELLAWFGRTDEARAELATWAPANPAEEAERAELQAHVAWCEGAADLVAIDELRTAIERLDDPSDRTRFQVSLALARTRADIATGRDDAIEHLAAVHGLIAPGSTASALALPYAWVIVGLFVAIGGTSITSAVIAALMGGD